MPHSTEHGAQKLFVPQLSLSNIFLCHNTARAVQLRSIFPFTATNNLKQHSSTIVEHAHLQCISNAPRLTCPCSCIPDHHDELNSICYSHTTIAPAWSRHPLHSHAVPQKHQCKYNCPSTRPLHCQGQHRFLT